ncbi:MAG: hypothetical protein KGZ81_15115 [Flavobacteriales bacterium]|nr:hypothetical protein [Flavobacteriales bacterium]
MKYLLFLFFTTNFIIAQYTVNDNGNVFTIRQELVKPSQIRAMLEGNEAYLKKYNNARLQKTIGNILMTTGIGFAGYNLIVSNKKTNYGETSNKDKYGPLLIGASAFVVGGIIKIGFKNKIIESVEQINSKQNISEVEMRVLANENGIGLKISF